MSRRGAPAERRRRALRYAAERQASPEAPVGGGNGDSKGPVSPPPSSSQAIPSDLGQPDLSGIENPWEYLEQARKIPKVGRASYGTTFLKLASKRDKLECDALVKEGAEVFGYRTQVGYKMVDDFRKDSELEPTSAAAIVAEDEGFLAEMVYSPGREEGPLGYLVHRFDTPDEPPEFKPSIEYRERLYTPGPRALIYKQALLVPSGFEEYGSTPRLIEMILTYVQSYIHLPDKGFQAIAALYVLMTWIADRLVALPYLRVLGDWGAAKSRFLQVFGSLCRLSLFASGATTAAPIFRALDAFSPTLILDEADFAKQEQDWALIYKVLNLGYSRGGGVLRCGDEGEDFAPQVFDVFGPKLLATRRPFSDAALESRCLTYRPPVLADQDLPAHIPLTFPPEAQQDALQLRNKLLLWRFRNWRTIVVDPRARIPGVELRVQQTVAPLLACVQGDETVRAILLAKARELGADIREKRQSGLEAEVLLAMQRLAKQAETDGAWSVSAVKHAVELDRDPGGGLGLRPTPTWLRVNETQIGSILMNLGFRRISHHGKGRSYTYNAVVLHKALAAYGLDDPQTESPKPAEELAEGNGQVTDEKILQQIGISGSGAGPVLG